MKLKMFSTIKFK